MIKFDFLDDIPLDFTGSCHLIEDNSIRYYKNGIFHRVDGPALFWHSYEEQWFIDGNFHREDGPAHIHSFGKEYYQYGLLHRENGPACEFKNGENHYCIKGKLHREDGPAVEYFDGKKAWHYKNKCYGTDDSFTIETWIEKVKEFKYLESLEIFK